MSDVRRVLIFRTAQLPEVQWAREEIARRYPGATVGVVGSRLKALGVFEDCVQFELPDGKITPETIRPLRRAIEDFAPDVAVMCLNTNGRAGYERISSAMRRIPARDKLVAGFDRTITPWLHADFVSGRAVTRWLVDVLGLALLVPAAFFYLLAKSPRPEYRA